MTYKQIHATTLALAKKHKLVEAEIIRNLQDVGRSRAHKIYDCATVFAYAVKFYEFTNDVAYAFTAVAKRCQQIPRLQAAIDHSEIKVAAAKRLLPYIENGNADQLITFCKTHSHREVEIELAKYGKETPIIERVKRLPGGKVQLTIVISDEDFENLERAQDLEAKRGKNLSRGEMVGTSLALFVDRKDPVKRAERARKKRDLGAPPNFADVEITYGRENMTAAQINAVNARDKGCCTHIGSDQKRCGESRWTKIHHIIEIARGGSNHPTNLTTLCSLHHDLVHQMNMPIDGQYSVLTSPTRPYRV